MPLRPRNCVMRLQRHRISDPGYCGRLLAGESGVQRVQTSSEAHLVVAIKFIDLVSRFPNPQLRFGASARD